MKFYFFSLCLFLISAIAFGQDKPIKPLKITFREAELLDNFVGPPEFKVGNESSITDKKPLPDEMPMPKNALITKEHLVGVEPKIANLPNENNLRVASPLPTASFNGLTDNSSFIPPDTKGAAGPNHLMVTLNSQFRIMDKLGAAVSTVSPTSFWSGITPDGAGDPHVFYNHFINRWIIVCQSNLNATSSILVAMSTTNDPTGTWNRYAFDVDATNTDAFDYPLIGFNQGKLIIAGNMFGIVSGSFTGTQIYLFNIADLAAGNTITIGTNAQRIANNTTQGFTISPCVVYETGAASSTIYALQNWNGGSASLRLTTITGNIPTAVWNTSSAVFVTGATTWNSGQGDFTPQSGTLNKINSGDNRLSNHVMVNGKLWVSHAVFLPQAAPTRSAIQWWQIQTNGAILQRGLIDDPTGVLHRTYPSLCVNVNEDVLIGYSISSVNMFPSAAYSYRSPCNTASTMQLEQIYKAGLSFYYKKFGGARNRWGDYSNTCLDPTTGDFWTIQEYAALRTGTADNDSRWGTWWARVTPQGASPEISFNTTNFAVSETGNLGTCPKYKDYTVNVNLVCAATANLTVNFIKAGTASNLLDYELLTNSVTYSTGQSGDKPITIRVYDDGNIEPNETIILSYTLTGSGGIVGSGNQSFTLTINNDDSPLNFSGSGMGSTLLSENFNAALTLPVGWTTTVAPGSGVINSWVISTNGGTGITTNAAHITNNTTTKPLAYTITSATQTSLITPSINATGIYNMKVAFKYKIDAELNFDYGALAYSLDGVNFTIFEGTSAGPFVNKTILTNADIAIPAACNNTTFKLAFVFIADAADGIAPPFIIDDVVVRTIPAGIETVANQTGIVNVLNGSSVTNITSSTGKIISKLENLNASLGCITANLPSAGTGQVSIVTNLGSFFRTAKVITLSPATASNTATYKISLYFTTAELDDWGIDAPNLKLLKVNDGVNLAGLVTGSQCTIYTPTVVDNRSTLGYVEYSATCTGFSQFMLASPIITLPITLISFTGSLNNNNALLNWTTSQEIDNSGFELQRSINGINFEPLTWIVGRGNSNTPVNYYYTDVSILNNKLYYYRLKQINTAGTIAYSNIIKLIKEKAINEIATIAPNPISNNLSINFNNAVKKPVITIFNANGQLLFKKQYYNSQTVINIDATKWAKGNYEVILLINKNRYSTKILKL